ncbi:uncharacterized protein BKA78DRAFT_6124 [Phyllosticta capitalensis]|uniref:uncharacterized protein n=1 Tax=Phyllosticta capitalensis TaxID=121624 RepID=UPI0031317582
MMLRLESPVEEDKGRRITEVVDEKTGIPKSFMWILDCHDLCTNQAAQYRMYSAQGLPMLPTAHGQLHHHALRTDRHYNVRYSHLTVILVLPPHYCLPLSAHTYLTALTGPILPVRVHHHESLSACALRCGCATPVSPLPELHQPLRIFAPPRTLL